MSTDASTASAQVVQQTQDTTASPGNPANDTSVATQQASIGTYTWDALGNVVPSVNDSDQRFVINEPQDIASQLETQDVDPNDATAVPYTVPLDEIAMYETQSNLVE